MTVTGSEVERFLAKEGKRGARVLSVLGELSPIKKALESDIGKLVIGDIATDMEQTLPKIINEEATDIELADFRAGRRLAEKVARRINAYYQEEGKVRKGRI